MSKKALLDLASRAAWTALQAAVGVLAVTLSTTIPAEAWWAIPIATVLSAVKSFLATRVGDPDVATFSS